MARRGYQRIIGGLLLFSGALLALWLTYALVRGQATHGWVESVGLIYESNLVQTTLNPGNRQGFFSADIHYQYRVYGNRFEGNQVFDTTIPFAGESEIKALLTQYPVGSVHPIYYNPQSPDQAVLRQGVSPLVLLSIAPVVLFLLIGFRALKG